MPLRYDTFLGSSGGAWVPPPEPEFTPPRADLLAYWFRAQDACSDISGTIPCTNGDPIAFIPNLGVGTSNAIQTTTINRPVFKTGGLNGRSYIECAAASQQYFEDIDLTQPSGVASARPRTIIVVTDNINLSDFRAILGSTDTNGGKAGLYFRSPSGAQVHYLKAGFRSRDIVNPQILFAQNRRGTNPYTEDTYTTAISSAVYRLNGISTIINNVDNASSVAITATQLLRCTGVAGGGNGYFDGHLYELLIYDGALNTNVWSEIEAYLMEKYGFVFTPGAF